MGAIKGNGGSPKGLAARRSPALRGAIMGGGRQVAAPTKKTGNLKEVCVADNMESLTLQSDDETTSEHASRTRWQFWNSVAEVMNAPSNVEVGWFVCHTNRVLWSMASQGYRRADGAAFLNEVANSGKFPDSYIKKARRSLDKYWKVK